MKGTQWERGGAVFALYASIISATTEISHRSLIFTTKRVYTARRRLNVHGEVTVKSQAKWLLVHPVRLRINTVVQAVLYTDVILGHFALITQVGCLIKHDSALNN